jgi:hypothetical protein
VSVIVDAWPPPTSAFVSAASVMAALVAVSPPGGTVSVDASGASVFPSPGYPSRFR